MPRRLKFIDPRKRVIVPEPGTKLNSRQIAKNLEIKAANYREQIEELKDSKRTPTKFEMIKRLEELEKKALESAKRFWG